MEKTERGGDVFAIILLMSNEEINQAIEVLENGGIIIFPTDTAFGIGCRIDRKDSVERLFRLRNRPENKATPVLVSSIEMAEQWVDTISEFARSLMEQYWPGGLTIVLKSHNKRVSPLVQGGTDTLGVRMPDHEDLLKIIEKVGVPILGPSANFAGEPTPFQMEHIDPKLAKLVDYVVPGKTKQRQSSTVVDCTVTPFKILRQGAVRLE